MLIYYYTHILGVIAICSRRCNKLQENPHLVCGIINVTCVRNDDSNNRMQNIVIGITNVRLINGVQSRGSSLDRTRNKNGRRVLLEQLERIVGGNLQQHSCVGPC